MIRFQRTLLGSGSPSTQPTFVASTESMQTVSKQPSLFTSMTYLLQVPVNPHWILPLQKLTIYTLIQNSLLLSSVVKLSSTLEWFSILRQSGKSESLWTTILLSCYPTLNISPARPRHQRNQIYFTCGQMPNFLETINVSNFTALWPRSCIWRSVYVLIY